MGYNFKKTIQKFLWSSLDVIIAGLIMTWTENEFALILIPVMQAIRNYLKNNRKA